MGRGSTSDLKHLSLGQDDLERSTVDGALAATLADVAARPRYAHALPIDQIASQSPAQTRRTFDPQTSHADAELVASVRQDGIKVPVVVVQRGAQDFQLAAGHRRVAASRFCGALSVPAIILPEGTEQAQIDQITFLENYHRQALSPMETARQLDYFRATHGWRQQEMANALHISQPMVSGYLALLKADAELQRLVDEKRVGLRNARSLMALPKAARAQSYKLIRAGVPISDVLADISAAHSGHEKGKSKRRKNAAPTNPTEDLVLAMLGEERMLAAREKLGGLAGFQGLQRQEQAGALLLGAMQGNDWPTGVRQWEQFPQAERRALAMTIKQLARLHVLGEGRTEVHPGPRALAIVLYALELLAKKDNVL